MMAVVLGRPSLLTLGLYFDIHLRRIESNIDGKSMSNQCSNKFEYTEMKYHDEDDPINCPEQLRAGFGKFYQEDIRNAFDKFFKDEYDNGITVTGLKYLNEVLAKCRSLFRIRLGPDEPTKVRRLRIKPIEGAKPFKCLQRGYSKSQRAFINHTIKNLEQLGAVY